MEEQKPFEVSAELQAAVDSALGTIQGRSFSQRRPELGKMVNCKLCGRRQRQIQELRTHNSTDGVKRASKFVGTVSCEQVFTYRAGDYELFREEENKETGEVKLVPAYRTALQPDVKPKKRQVVGAAAFTKKRIKPHPSKLKLRLIEVTREVFAKKGFPLEGENFQLDLAKARLIAGFRAEAERRYRNRDPRRRSNAK